MFITTKAEFVWDKELEKYVEIHTEGFEYEGELDLAQNGDDEETVSANWESTPDYGYDTWQPGTNEMINWMEGANMSMEDLAYGFGLERDDSGYLPNWEDLVWKGREGGYYEQQETAARDAYTRSIDEAYEGVEGGVAAEKTATGESMYEAMEASRERVAQSMFTGFGTRGKDRAMRSLSGAYEDTTKGLSKKLTKAEKDAFAKKEDVLRDTVMKREDEKRGWVEEVYSVLGTLSGRGINQREQVDLSKYMHHGAGPPTDDWGDSHGDTHYNTTSQQASIYDDPGGFWSNGQWIDMEPL